VGRRLDQTVAATHGALVEGEHVAASGFCWAAQLQRVPLLFLGRRRYLMILTTRRLLLFDRRGRRPPRPSDLVIGKRYEWFKLGRVRRARPLLQVLVTTGNESRMLFEFPPRYREMARTLVTRLERGDAPPAAAATDPADRARATAGAGAGAGASADDTVFWGPSPPTS